MIDSDSPVNKPIDNAIFSRRRLLLISLGLVCLIVIGGAIWMKWQQPSAVVPLEAPLPSEGRLQEPANQAEVKQGVVVVQSGVELAPVVSETHSMGTLSKHAKQVYSQKQATASVSKLPAQLTLQQQAENEFRRSAQLKQQGSIAEAQNVLENALKLDAGHEQARLELAGMLMDKKLNSEAEQLLKEGLQLNPRQSEFALLLARLQVERNDLSDALKTLQVTLPYAEESAEYQSFVAALLQRQDKYQDAIGYYQKALQIKPNTGVWMVGLGMSLRAVNRNNEARNIFKDALDSNTLNAELRSYVTSQLKAL
jgi:MSHA biogenesis protein MshN